LSYFGIKPDGPSVLLDIAALTLHVFGMRTGIEDIKRTELTPSEREVLEEDRKRWRRMGTGAHLDEWLAYGPGIAAVWSKLLSRRHLNRKRPRQCLAGEGHAGVPCA
jgi:hypothetical protein